MKLFVAGQSSWSLSNAFVKFSILDLYTKIFPSKTFHRACYAVMILTSCNTLVIILETFLVCRPFAFNWDKTIANGRCADVRAAFVAAGLANVIIDVIVVVLPIQPLWKLQMAVSMKIQVIAIFCLGSL